MTLRAIASPFLAMILSLGVVAGAAARDLAAPEAHSAARAGDVALVDVRTPEEWSETGVPAGATPIDMRDPAFLDRLAALRADDPDRPIAFICRTGRRSGHVVSELRKRGWTGLAHVPEGVAGSESGPGWIARGLPLEPR